ncbi:GNAT family N-acetyltransferase [Catenuloplanes atrovinosus]|uniref:N-acetyltransferase YhbS n=1 Tax=Catenuloplanes atrovinosus TaxID=137266 RepID=A0AAE3YXU8_9ACTN|nr:GNAT family N-acetyltransferase [Catenuloplanes atrovinosus]MDR7280398.1 putative N-acetyltransferase YhbS [Catenuloplanes atrovinosus]
MDAEFAIRELTDDDVPAVVTLCAGALDLPEDAAEAAEIVLRLRERPSPESPAGHRTLGYVAFDAEDAVLGAVLCSIAQRDPGTGHVDLIAVRPDARRRGIGRALMVRAEAGLAGLGASEVLLAGNSPYYAWPGVDVRYTPAVCAAMALGYEQDRTAWNMTADLAPGSAALRETATAERRLAEAGITVRLAHRGDIPRLVEFADRTFGGDWPSEVADSIGRDRAGCHLAERDGEILGFAAYGSSRPSWFGPMGTAAAAEGLGIGGVLLRRCLADQHAHGHSAAQIGWVGPVPFYSGAAGARIERVFFLYRKQL